MATPIAFLVAQTRRYLSEETPKNWSDAELTDLANLAFKDLWRRLNDLYKNYFVTTDITNVTLPQGATQLSGVPDDVFRVVAIEPRVVGESNPNLGLVFKPVDYNDPRFVEARACGTRQPNNTVVFYTLMTAGAPVAAPIILTAPPLSSAVDVKLVYNQVLAPIAIDGDNPIPGESDSAVIAWVMAHARAKERADGAPDPTWMGVYTTEKDKLIMELTPRQIQEPSVADDFFGEGYGYGY